MAINLKKIIGIIFITLFLSIISTPVDAQTSSFGVSPPSMYNDILLRGSHFEQNIVLSRANPDVSAKAVIEVDEGVLQEWITFEPGLEVDLPVGEQRITIKAVVDIPEDANLGIYEGGINIVLQQPDASGQVILLPAVELVVNISVVDELVSDLRVLSIGAYDLYVGENVIFDLKAINTGNTASNFTKMEIDFLTGTQAFYSSHSVSDFTPIDPFTESIESLPVLENSLSIGSYFADVKIYVGDEIIYTDKIVFQVLEEVSIGTEAGLVNKNLGYALMIAGILVIGFVFFFVYKRKKEDQE